MAGEDVLDAGPGQRARLPYRGETTAADQHVGRERRGRIILGEVEENRARRVVDALRERGIDGHLARVGIDQFGIRVSLPGGREAEWDTDGTAGLEAQVMRDGMLVGFVPMIEGSEDFDEEQVVDAIARTDYDQPIARQRPVAPPPGPPLPRAGGLFRRFLDGFRYR